MKILKNNKNIDIILRDLDLKDKVYFFDWIKDSLVIKYSLSIFQNMKNNEEISQWFDKVLLESSSYNQSIVDQSNGKVIGYAGISNLSKTNLSGEYFIFIGDKTYHSKGIGSCVTKEITKYGFEHLFLYY